MNKDNFAWHQDSIVAADFFVRVDLTSHGMANRFEQLWVKQVGERQFEICSIPFFTYGISLGDVVHTDEDMTVQRVISKSGHKTLRVVVANKSRQGEFHETLHGWVNTTGLLSEWYAPGYLSVDIPPELNDRDFLAPLNQLIDSHEISYEIDE